MIHLKEAGDIQKIYTNNLLKGCEKIEVENESNYSLSVVIYNGFFNGNI